MKKATKVRRAMAVLLVIAMVVVMMPSVAFATENRGVAQEESFVEEVISTTALMNSVVITGEWTDILPHITSGNGFNRTISVSANNGATNHVNSIRMIGRDGRTVLWGFGNAVGFSHQNVRFWLGADVYRVQMRVISTSVVNTVPFRAQIIVRDAQ
ncbi:hypothetical protein FWD07_03400 [Candidatus Saccharibacteria bacterium]|nr:hypothetical protein [Candidatus Saccharibacteria bacterium]